mmetsp:Transcript_6843/g.6133  ORF Transcript_6843/g.6133 Transcript_6843/m.6133 type:complete len:98 (+) Transcript_6843:92-385(+)
MSRSILSTLSLAASLLFTIIYTIQHMEDLRSQLVKCFLNIQIVLGRCFKESQSVILCKFGSFFLLHSPLISQIGLIPNQQNNQMGLCMFLHFGQPLV